MEAQNEKEAKEILNDIMYKEFKFKIMTKMDSYQGQQKPKH